MFGVVVSILSLFCIKIVYFTVISAYQYGLKFKFVTFLHEVLD